jgi:hypothetical protein
MSRLEALIRQQQGMTIEVPPTALSSLKGSPVRFTLSFQGRSIQDEIYSREDTLAPPQALTALFLLIEGGQKNPTFQQMSMQKEQQLRHLLGSLYESFWKAYSEDQQEQLEQQRSRTQAAFAAYSEEKLFEAGERVRYLGGGNGSREGDWVYCTVIREVWRENRLDGVLVKREKDGLEMDLQPQCLTKESKWR